MTSALARREDWPERLQEALARHAAQPFRWGTSDCLLLAMDGVLAMTGEDPAAAIRGRYRSASGAWRLLRRHGHRSIAEALAARFEEIPVALAGRGDLGLVEVPEGPAGTAGPVGPAAPVALSTVVFFGLGAFGKATGTPGNVFVPRSAVLRAFKV